MKNKTVKFLVWLALEMISLYFVFFGKGVFTLEFTPQQLATVLYAFLAALVWGIYRRSNDRSSSYLLAALLYVSVMLVMFFTQYFLSPTSMVALIALFYYSSKIFTFSFKK